MPQAQAHPRHITAKGWFAVVKRVFAQISEDHLLLVAAGLIVAGYIWIKRIMQVDI